MSKNNVEILSKIYAGTQKGELLKKKEMLIKTYLQKYGKLIMNKEVKPTPVIEVLAREFGFTRIGATQILRKAGVYQGCNNPVVFPR